jgi:hypothetical protein
MCFVQLSSVSSANEEFVIILAGLKESNHCLTILQALSYSGGHHEISGCYSMVLKIF